jgi:hypothetical protein
MMLRNAKDQNPKTPKPLVMKLINKNGKFGGAESKNV